MPLSLDEYNKMFDSYISDTLGVNKTYSNVTSNNTEYSPVMNRYINEQKMIAKKDEEYNREQFGLEPGEVIIGNDKEERIVDDIGEVSFIGKDGEYAGPKANYINKYSKQYGVDPFIVASVMEQEGGFKHNNIGPKKDGYSSAGAYGAMQLMPKTAEDLGVDRYDEEQNIKGGIMYLSQMYKQFGNWRDAIMAYNTGPGNLTNWKLGKKELLPETKKYIKSISAIYNTKYGKKLDNESK